MSDVMQERRRWTRVAVEDDGSLELSLVHQARLIDISMTGALMDVSQDPPVGRRAELRTTLGDSPFMVHVEIRRVAGSVRDGDGAGARKVGVAFVVLDVSNRRCLERFLRQPPSA